MKKSKNDINIKLINMYSVDYLKNISFFFIHIYTKFPNIKVHIEIMNYFFEHF